MTLQGKHDFGEIDGKRVTFVEKGTSEARMKFLKALLEHNGFNVLVETDASKSEDDKKTFTIGVDDIIFNPTIWVYERRLKTFDNKLVNPAYWEQINDDNKPEYWEEMFAEEKRKQSTLTNREQINDGNKPEYWEEMFAETKKK